MLGTPSRTKKLTTPCIQKLDINGVTFYFYAETYEEKESWIGALGRAMIKPSIMIDSAFDNEYM